MKIILLAISFTLAFMLPTARGRAASLEDLDAARMWRVAAIEISGTDQVSGGIVRDALLTQSRPWFRFWEQRPEFDPITFREDLQRVTRVYESRGFYHARIDYDLAIDEERGLVTAKIAIVEGEPAHVADIDVNVRGSREFPEKLPLKSGDVFTEDAYHRSEQILQRFYGERGYAHVETERKAQVILDENAALVGYDVATGPPTVFGPTAVNGLRNVEPEIVLRERAYKEGERFSLTKMAATRTRLLALDLFGTVNIAPQKTPDKPPVVPMAIEVTERAPREIRLGLGYGSEDRFRTQLEWRHNNWLGDGRRLSITGKYSSLEATGALTFIQPHLFSPRAQGVVVARQDREDEDTYLLNASRFRPRLEYRFTEHLSGFLGYRFEYNTFDDVSDVTVAAIGAIRRHGFLSGPGVGLLWTTVDNLLDPKRGQTVSLGLDYSGEPWGASYRFLKLVGDAKKYWGIGWETIFAARIRLGFADPLGAVDRLPLSERFYAGGEKSVRGYGRRRLGPLSAADDPIGGLSLLEGSFELRRPIWNQIGGALFVDFGQVSTRRFHVPVTDLEFSAGFGLSYNTPVGPLRVDIGFPFDPPRGDSAFQIHFSIGAYF
jgi:outer membrane protein assembly complex protein YaeT